MTKTTTKKASLSGSDKVLLGTARAYKASQIHGKRLTSAQQDLSLEVWEIIEHFPDDDIAAILLGCLALFGDKLANQQEA